MYVMCGCGIRAFILGPLIDGWTYSEWTRVAALLRHPRRSARHIRVNWEIWGQAARLSWNNQTEKRHGTQKRDCQSRISGSPRGVKRGREAQAKIRTVHYFEVGGIRSLIHARLRI